MTQKQHQRPQRLKAPAPPGVLLKRPLENARRLKLREILGNDPVYLALVRQCPCLKCGMDPPPNNHAAHIRMSSGTHAKYGGMQKKPADKWVLPLCAGCHVEDSDSQHKLGEHVFFDRLGINPLLVCQRLYRQRGDLVAMRAVILSAIAERESLSQLQPDEDERR